MVQRGSSRALACWDSVLLEGLRVRARSLEPLQGLGEKSGEVHSSWLGAIFGRRPPRDPWELADQGPGASRLSGRERQRGLGSVEELHAFDARPRRLEL